MVTAREYNDLRKGTWVGDLGIEILSVEPGNLTAQVKVRKELLSPNGYLHAASVVTLADSLCGSGTMENLPRGASGYTTIELKANLVGTARQGTIECKATLVHSGRQYAGVGCARPSEGERQDDRPVSMHADDPFSQRPTLIRLTRTVERA